MSSAWRGRLTNHGYLKDIEFREADIPINGNGKVFMRGHYKGGSLSLSGVFENGKAHIVMKIDGEKHGSFYIAEIKEGKRIVGTWMTTPTVYGKLNIWRGDVEEEEGW